MGKLAQRLSSESQTKATRKTISGTACSKLAQRLGMALDEKPASAEPSATKAEMDFETAKQQLAADIERLREVEDVEARLPIKAEIVQRYMPLVDDYVQGGKRYPNSVAVQLLIYLFDLGDIAQALPLALHLVKQGIHRTPNNFKSNLATFVCDGMSDWAAEKLKRNSSALPYMTELAKTVGADPKDNDWDLQYMVRAKVLAIAGKHEEQFGDKSKALALYEAALTLDKKAGVKTRYEKLKESV